jgi:hypothetical protein
MYCGDFVKCCIPLEKVSRGLDKLHSVFQYGVDRAWLAESHVLSVSTHLLDAIAHDIPRS